MMLFKCFCAASILATCTGCYDQDKEFYDLGKAPNLFLEFILNHNKHYPTLEETLKRFQIFQYNLEQVNEINKKSKAVFGITRFSDLTPEEFKRYTGFNTALLYNGFNDCQNLTDKEVNVEKAPPSLNWVEKGAVTGIKDQEHCGSCWAFGCIGNIESQYYIKTNKLEILSEQELLDCSRLNQGCIGGYMDYALTDLIHLGGVVTESAYPYIAAKGECKFDKSKVVTPVKECKNYALTDEGKLMDLLADNGPLIIGLNAMKLSNYKKGIISFEDCDSKEWGGHAVLLVGYGTEDGVDYWTLKNSWGPRFGESGYFRLHRGDNTCQMLTYIGTAVL